MSILGYCLGSAAVWAPAAERPSRRLTDAAAARGVQQEAVRTHARVPATSVGTLPVLATPTCGALVHICKDEGRFWPVGDHLPGSPAPRRGLPTQVPLTLSKPVGQGPFGPFTRLACPVEKGGVGAGTGWQRDGRAVLKVKWEGLKGMRCGLSTKSASLWQLSR